MGRRRDSKKIKKKVGNKIGKTYGQDGFLKKMLGAEILTDAEKTIYRGYYDENLDPEVDHTFPHETLEIKNTSTRGEGVFAKKDIPKDSYVGDFFGRLARRVPAESRYSFDLKKDLYVSADNKNERSMLAYCNHECFDFNCKVWRAGTSEGTPRVYFWTTRDIRAGEELTIKYSDTYFDEAFPCYCSTCGNNNVMPEFA